jgi:hypothetical protein
MQNMIDEIINNKLKIDELLEWVIERDGINIENGMIKDANTVLATGKAELAQLVGGTDTKSLDRIFADLTGSPRQAVALVTPKGTSSGVDYPWTLSCVQSSYFTTPGTYTAVYSGNNTQGSADPYNSISTGGIIITTGSSLQFTVKWIFSGLNSTTGKGNVIVGHKMGGTGSTTYDITVSSIGYTTTIDAAIAGGTIAITPTVSANSLGLTQNTALAGPTTIGNIKFLIGGVGALPIDHIFEPFGPYTINIGTGSSILTTGTFTFG